MLQFISGRLNQFLKLVFIYVNNSQYTFQDDAAIHHRKINQILKFS